MDIFDIQNLKTHGGSIRYFIKKKQNNKIKIFNKVQKQFKAEKRFGLEKLSTYKKFALNVKSSKKKLLNILKKIKEKNKSIVGYGATAKAVTILNYCKINKNFIDYFLDTTPDKQNKLLPGTNIKILKYSQKKMSKIDFIFLGAWNFKFEIFKKEKRFINKGGKFVTHVPKPKIL